MAEENRERYRALPGRRRGFLFGSSVWMGPDHLLLVKSSRFREEYRRFYFRDVQAIVTAGAPRFHISTRSAVIGAIWLTLFGLSAAAAPVWPRLAVGGAGLLLALVWAYISGKRSCRCYIHTAVSSEELRSVYRVWTARKFLARVEPAVIAAQGAIEGDASEIVEERQVGALPEGRVGLNLPGAPPQPSAPPARTPVSALFAGSLCLGAVAELSTLGARPEAGQWILLGFLLLQIGSAVAVIVQSAAGRLRASLRNLAVVTLALIGVWYYGVMMSGAISAGYASARSKKAQPMRVETQRLETFGLPAARGSAGALSMGLGVAALILLARGTRPEAEKGKISFNV